MPSTTKKRVSRGSRKTSVRRISDKERQYQALEMRKERKSFQAIADALGYADRAAAWNAVMNLLSEIPVANADQLRADQNEVLDGIVAELWPKRQQPSVALAILRCEERRARLMGIDLDPKAADELRAALAAAHAEARVNVFVINGERKRPEDLTLEELDAAEAYLAVETSSPEGEPE